MQTKPGSSLFSPESRPRGVPRSKGRGVAHMFCCPGAPIISAAAEPLFVIFKTCCQLALRPKPYHSDLELVAWAPNAGGPSPKRQLQGGISNGCQISVPMKRPTQKGEPRQEETQREREREREREKFNQTGRWTNKPVRQLEQGVATMPEGEAVLRELGPQRFQWLILSLVFPGAWPVLAVNAAGVGRRQLSDLREGLA